MKENEKKNVERIYTNMILSMCKTLLKNCAHVNDRFLLTSFSVSTVSCNLAFRYCICGLL